jgi:hypothetical protein
MRGGEEDVRLLFQRGLSPLERPLPGLCQGAVVAAINAVDAGVVGLMEIETTPTTPPSSTGRGAATPSSSRGWWW